MKIVHLARGAYFPVEWDGYPGYISVFGTGEKVGDPIRGGSWRSRYVDMHGRLERDIWFGLPDEVAKRYLSPRFNEWGEDGL